MGILLDQLVSLIVFLFVLLLPVIVVHYVLSIIKLKEIESMIFHYLSMCLILTFSLFYMYVSLAINYKFQLGMLINFIIFFYTLYYYWAEIRIFDKFPGIPVIVLSSILSIAMIIIFTMFAPYIFRDFSSNTFSRTYSVTREFNSKEDVIKYLQGHTQMVSQYDLGNIYTWDGLIKQKHILWRTVFVIELKSQTNYRFYFFDNGDVEHINWEKPNYK